MPNCYITHPRASFCPRWVAENNVVLVWFLSTALCRTFSQCPWGSFLTPPLIVLSCWYCTCAFYCSLLLFVHRNQPFYCHRAGSWLYRCCHVVAEHLVIQSSKSPQGLECRAAPAWLVRLLSARTRVRIVFVFVFIWMKHCDGVLLQCQHWKNEKWMKGDVSLYLTFWSTTKKRKRKNMCMYSQQSLFQSNDYYLHCISKCSCYLVLTEEQHLSLSSSEVSSCNLYYCGILYRPREITAVSRCLWSSLLLYSVFSTRNPFQLVSLCVPCFPFGDKLQMFYCKSFYWNSVILFAV